MKRQEKCGDIVRLAANEKVKMTPEQARDALPRFYKWMEKSAAAPKDGILPQEKAIAFLKFSPWISEIREASEKYGAPEAHRKAFDEWGAIVEMVRAHSI